MSSLLKYHHEGRSELEEGSLDSTQCAPRSMQQSRPLCMRRHSLLRCCKCHSNCLQKQSRLQRQSSDSSRSADQTQDLSVCTATMVQHKLHGEEAASFDARSVGGKLTRAQTSFAQFPCAYGDCALCVNAGLATERLMLEVSP